MKLFVVVGFLSLLCVLRSTGSVTREEKDVELSSGLKLDAEALRALKARIVKDVDGAIQNWDESSNPCYWNGVQCEEVEIRVDNEEQVDIRVVSLDLWGLGLEGSLSPEIGKLSELQRLVLVGNAFYGPIPDEIGNCRKLTVLDLRLSRLSGHITLSLFDFPALEVLSLSENEISGTLDVLFGAEKRFGKEGLCPRLQVLDLAKNQIQGSIPSELNSCTQLLEVSLNNNLLVGPIPSVMNYLLRLTSLLLNSNLLSGTVPASIGQCTNLQYLDVSKNALTGLIPAEFAKLVGEKSFNFSNNDFEGPLPLGRWEVQRMVLSGSFSHNPRLCGWPMTKVCESSATEVDRSSELKLETYVLGSRKWSSSIRNRRSVAETDSPTGSPVEEKEDHTARKWAVGVITGMVAGAICAAVLSIAIRLIIFSIQKRPARQGPIIFDGREISLKMIAFLENNDHQFSEDQLIGEGGAGKVYRETLRAPQSDESKVAAAQEALRVVAAQETPRVAAAEGGATIRKEMRVPPLAAAVIEVTGPEEASVPSAASEVAGQQESSVCDATTRPTEQAQPRNSATAAGPTKNKREKLDVEVAIKVVEDKRGEDGRAGYGQKHIHSELSTLGGIRHRNLVSLLAYVHRPNSHLLIYPFMPNRSLDDVLQRVDSGELDLPWPKRHQIAVGAAEGLAYLHFEMPEKKSIIHRDVKPSNILLDDEFVAHLADFGLAKVLLDVSHLSFTSPVGTIGYFAPEYRNSGKYSTQSDVYSFGITLIVLLTGKKPRDEFFSTQPGGFIGISEWLLNLMQADKLTQAIDPRIRGPEFDAEICLALRVAVLCTKMRPSERPTSKEALAMLNQIRKATGPSTTAPLPSSYTETLAVVDDNETRRFPRSPAQTFIPGSTPAQISTSGSTH